jgi:hypothetical protein
LTPAKPTFDRTSGRISGLLVSGGLQDGFA